MPVIYSNFFSTVITDNPLTIGASTVNAAGLSSFPTVAAPDYAWLTLDSSAINGAPEIVKVTSHSASATVASIVRGQQGTTARQHPSGTRLVQSITQSDLVTMNARMFDSAANRPAASSALNGYDFYATDTQTLSVCDGTGWTIIDEPPQSWTPSFGANITVGNGTFSNNFYRRSGGLCHYQFKFTLGSTSAVGASGGTSTFALPFTPNAVTYNMPAVAYQDNSAAQAYAGTSGNGANSANMQLYYWSVVGSTLQLNGPGIINTAPFTWAVSDTIEVQGWFRMNSRYT